MILSRMIQSRVFNQRISKENKSAQDQISTFLGEEKFNEVLKAQETHMKEYFKFEEETIENDDQVTEINEQEVLEENDKSESN